MRVADLPRPVCLRPFRDPSMSHPDILQSLDEYRMIMSKQKHKRLVWEVEETLEMLSDADNQMDYLDMRSCLVAALQEIAHRRLRE